MWSQSQKYRLALEKEILAREMPQFRFCNLSSDTYVVGKTTTSGRRRWYELTLLLPECYPDEMPELYVSSPVTLWKEDGCETVNDEEVSHSFHTLSNGPDGCVQICHFKPDLWYPSIALTAVLMKGLLWLEAYEAHLRTGDDIASFLC